MSARPAHRRTLLVAATAVLSCVAVVQVAAADPLDPIDDAASASAVAVRGASVQAVPPPPPADHAGCTKGVGTRVSASVDPAQRWYVDVQNTNWKIAFYPRPGPRGAVAVVGDSLTLAAMEETMRELIGAGYGPVCIDGQVSRRVSIYTSSIPSGVQEIARIKGTDPVWRLDHVRWVLALGTNDARANTSTYAATIQNGRNAVGASSVPIFWINVRTRLGEPYTNYENQWNTRLPGASTVVINWSAAVQTSPSAYINNTDLIHLTAAGEVLRAQITVAALAAS